MMIELWTLIFLIIVSLAWIYFHRREGFTTKTAAADVHLQACPTGFTSFYQSDGTTLCCEGEVIAKRCMGKRQCMLSGHGEVASCAEMLLEMYEEKGKDMCPASMPAYFEGEDGRGCTDGPYNATLTGPKGKQPVCRVYSTVEENAQKVDSCANEKEKDSFPCFGKSCTKEIVSIAADKPAKIAVHFVDNTGMQRTAYTRASLQRYLNAANPNWRDSMDLQKNIGVAEVAKAYYVDHTMQQADVQV